MHKLRETRPPKLRSDELASFEVARVTGGLMVVATGEDEAMKGILQENINATFVSQDVVIERPV